MKTLNECKEYFKDVHKDYLQYGSYGERQSLDRYNMMNEVMNFIYPEFKDVKLHWIQESLDEYYSLI